MAVQIGKVKTHAMTILVEYFQRTADRRRDAATPINEVVMVWVVLRGMPVSEARKIVVDAASSAPKPCQDSICTIFSPIMLMILYPPTEVPNPIEAAHSRITHTGTWNSGITPPITKAITNTPMNFCPSFMPWLYAMNADENICSRSNKRLDSAG